MRCIMFKRRASKLLGLRDCRGSIVYLSTDGAVKGSPSGVRFDPFF